MRSCPTLAYHVLCLLSPSRSPLGRPQPLPSRVWSPPALRASLLHGSPPPAANRPSALSHRTAKQPRSRLELQLLRRLRKSSCKLPFPSRLWRHRDLSPTNGFGFVEMPTIAVRTQAAKGLKPPSPPLPPPLRQYLLSPANLLLYTSNNLAVSKRIRVQGQDRKPPTAATNLDNQPPRVTAAGETAPISSFPGLRRLLRRRGA